LKELDIKGLKNLEFVSCKTNYLQKLSIQDCSKLTYLDYSVQKSMSSEEISEEFKSGKLKTALLKKLLIKFKQKYGEVKLKLSEISH